MPSLSTDVELLQRAVSTQNVIVAAYDAMLALPVVGDLAPFLTRTRARHASHAAAFTDAAGAAGGTARSDQDPALAQVVAAGKPHDLDSVLTLAVTCEDTAAAACVASVSAVSTPALRSLFLSVAAVEAQHRAVLLVLQAQLAAGQTPAISLPGGLAAAPAAVGSVGFPGPFYATEPA